MRTKLVATRFYRGFICAVLSIALGFSSPKVAVAQSGYTNGDLGSFVAFVCGNRPNSNLAEILRDVLDMLLSVQLQLNGITVNGGGLSGDPSQCLPGFNNPQLPNLPGLPNLVGCFDFSAFGNIGSNIGNCMNSVMGQFSGLNQYFSQYNWNYQTMLQCLQGLVVVPTITIPDFLANLRATLTNIVGLLNSVNTNYPVYNGFYNFFIDFCGNHYNAAGYTSGGGGGGNRSYSNTVSSSGTSVVMSAAPIGGPGSAVMMPSSAVAILKKKGGKAKAYPMSCGADACKRTIKNVARGTYTASINLMGADGVPTTMTKTTITIK